MTQTPQHDPTSLFSRVRAHIARFIAPKIGDEKTERHEHVMITALDHGYAVTGFDGEPAETVASFEETVEFVTINGEHISFDDELHLKRGVVFEYYWNPDLASIDIIQ